MSLLEKNDLLFAHIAINISSGLSANTRRVAGAILWHFNRKTGQCNPSVERLAQKLEINRATVLRATAELCSEEVGMFTKISHGGKFHTASYTPQWPKFRSIVRQFNDDFGSEIKAKIEAEKASINVAELRPQQSQTCDLNGRNSATQTYRRNLLKEPIATVQVLTPENSPQKSARKKPSQGLRKMENASTVSPVRYPSRFGNQASHSHAAREGAERRWYRDLKRMDSNTSMLIEMMLGERLDVYEAATDAELRKKGAGLRHVLEVFSTELQPPSDG